MLCQKDVKPGRACFPGMTKGKKSTAQRGLCGWGTPSDMGTPRAGWLQTGRVNVCLVLPVPPLCPLVVRVLQQISRSTQTPLPVPRHASLLQEMLGWAVRASEGTSIGWRAYCCEKHVTFLSWPLPSPALTPMDCFCRVFMSSLLITGEVMFQLSFIHFCKALWFLSSIAVEKGSLERLKITI